MMSGGMGSMMAGTMGFGWLVALFLVIGGVAIFVKLLGPVESSGSGGIGNIILIALAVIGGVALVAALAMGTMHFGMMR